MCRGRRCTSRNKANGPDGGEKNGTRQRIKQRNLEIAARHRRGESVARLMEEYHLGYDSIKKIVRKYGKERL